MLQIYIYIYMSMYIYIWLEGCRSFLHLQSLRQVLMSPSFSLMFRYKHGPSLVRTGMLWRTPTPGSSGSAEPGTRTEDWWHWWFNHLKLWIIYIYVQRIITHSPGDIDMWPIMIWLVSNTRKVEAQGAKAQGGASWEKMLDTNEKGDKKWGFAGGSTAFSDDFSWWVNGMK